MTELPIRKLSRMGNEFHLIGARAIMRSYPGKYERGMVLVLLLKRCAADWLAADGFARPDAITRGATINAMATSIDKPYATIYRHVTALIAEGWACETPHGYAIANTAAVEPAIVAMMVAAHDALIRLIEDRAVDFPPTAVRGAGTRRAVRDATLLAALDMWLVPYECARRPAVDWTRMLVTALIAVANVRHITEDPVLRDRYAFDPTPDAIRRPVSTRAIAAMGGLGYGTVFRHCQALAAHDVLCYDERGGWLIASRHLFDEDIDQGVRALLRYSARRIGELVGIGLDITDPHALYLGPRPEYVPLAPSDALVGAEVSG